MFRSRACHYQRATIAPFPMLRALASHTNQGLACFDHHRPRKEVRRSREQALHTLLSAPLVANSSGTTNAGSVIVYIFSSGKAERGSSSFRL
ncbi:hypothetical protein AXF42_Ash013487 [Apostasia shenzhenica]|uniref:Uncharacterized protein n=1 Tax=Apostasia shenzhenica TaxID=1088818 RepID=A0A2I0A4D2_9ASPA|nr:hypothetical protein AXF42_Ash013487 [Apostasia shenzhenica]